MTPRQLAAYMRNNQILCARRRNHAPPTYSTQELHNWLIAQPNFDTLYQEWMDSGYARPKALSCDRLNDRISYTFSNIRLTTTKNNVQRYGKDSATGINTKRCKAVDQLDSNGNFIKRYHSASAAGRACGGKAGANIASALRCPSNTAYGYLWRYSTTPNDDSEIT